MSKKFVVVKREATDAPASAKDIPSSWKRGGAGFDLLAGARQRIGDPCATPDPRRHRRRKK